MFYIGSCPDQTTDVAEGLARFVLAFFLCLRRGGEPKIGALYTPNLNHRTMMWYSIIHLSSNMVPLVGILQGG